jgi:hypothetical protein
MTQWIVQDSLNWTALQNNCSPLISTLQKMGIPFTLCGVIPFEHTITGIEQVNFSIPTMFYGGTVLPILAKKLNCSTGIFWEDGWWNPNIWATHRKDMLNQSVNTITLSQLREDWITQPVFVKPVAVKEFTGMVLEGPDRDWFNEEYNELSGDLKICCSPIQKIEREWRFWIIDGKIITGSLYKKYGYLTIREPIGVDIWKAAEQLLKNWVPSDTVVMDAAQLTTGEFKIVEFNSINSSGFYNADISKIVTAIEKKYE